MANQVHGPEGMIFANKYRIVKLIGSGGMANVYLGIDMNTGVNVAIKILKPEFSSDEEFIRRFDAEAKSVASLNHANIVKVYGVGHEGNFRYLLWTMLTRTVSFTETSSLRTYLSRVTVLQRSQTSVLHVQHPQRQLQ